MIIITFQKELIIIFIHFYEISIEAVEEFLWTLYTE